MDFTFLINPENWPQWFKLWCVFGFIWLLIVPVAKTKLMAATTIIIAGPLCWALLPITWLKWKLKPKTSKKKL